MTMITRSLTILLAVLALGAGLQPGTPDTSAPTAVEQALVEYRCRVTQASGVSETDAHQACMTAQLLSLRGDFGHDLNRLSGAMRRTIDSTCSKVRELRGRDAYVECLSGALVAPRSRGNARSPTSPAETTLPPPSPSVASTSPVLPTNSGMWSSYGLWIGSAVLVLGLAGGGAVLFKKTRRVPRKCQVCGIDIPDSGDLCQQCRREAADVLRRAAAERAELQRVQEEQRQ